MREPGVHPTQDSLIAAQPFVLPNSLQCFARIIGYDYVSAQGDYSIHARWPVDRPDMDRLTPAMGRSDKGTVDAQEFSTEKIHLEAFWMACVYRHQVTNGYFRLEPVDLQQGIVFETLNDNLVRHSANPDGLNDPFGQPRLVVSVVFQFDIQANTILGDGQHFIESWRRFVSKFCCRLGSEWDGSDFSIRQIPHLFRHTSHAREVAVMCYDQYSIFGKLHIDLSVLRADRNGLSDGRGSILRSLMMTATVGSDGDWPFVPQSLRSQCNSDARRDDQPCRNRN